jgi:hypothetical protein
MKKLIIILLPLLILTGCKKQEKINLNKKYYNEGKFITINSLENLEEETYILYTYNNYCSFEIPCDQIFKQYMEKYKIDFLQIPFKQFKETNLYKKVKYAPSIIIVKEGKIISYLDANKNKDLKKYQDINEFEKWINKYIEVKESN